MPQSPLGGSVWTMGWWDTYLDGRPTQRFCAQLAQHGFLLSQSTRTEGLQRRKVWCEPLRPVLDERQRPAKLLHGDETRWEVCEEGAGTTGQRWSLWVRPSASVVSSGMAPGRGADVPKGHVAKVRKALGEVGLVCDRSRASKSLAQDYHERIFASCWA
jgi:hypothetical protein